MKQIEITSERLTEGTELLEKAGAGASLLLPAEGGGILLELKDGTVRTVDFSGMEGRMEL